MAEVPEVGTFYDFNQLEPGKSQDRCGFAAVALCFGAGPLGSDPYHPVQWAIEKMSEWYVEMDGKDISSNTNGMEDWQLYKLIKEKGGHYQAIDPHAESIASWIRARYPVIIAVQESSVFDVHLNARPYDWNTTGLNHIFTVTGIDHGHVFLCRDTVNQHTGSPYSYDGDKLVYLSATVFVPDWLPRPTSAIAPHATAPAGVPAGWHDDGHNLTGPHGEGPVVLGFRDFVLKHNWDPSNVPMGPQYYTQQLEVSNPDLGDGDQIIFELGTILGYAHNPKDVGLKNKVIVEYAGKEFLAVRQALRLALEQVDKYYKLAVDLRQKALAMQADNATLATDNAKLQADVQALQQALPK